MTDLPSQPARPAPFIVFEGIEGCGKSTQIELLAGRLRSAGREPLLTREPGGTPLGEALRKLLLDWTGGEIDGLTELFLLEASRRVHVRTVVRPALEAGRIVISDRFADSSIAYQGGGRGLDVGMIERFNRVATGGLAADLTILLDLPAEQGLERVRRRDRVKDRLEREVLAFHESVRDAYLTHARERGEPGYRIIDARRSPDDIAACVYAWVAAVLAGGSENRG